MYIQSKTHKTIHSACQAPRRMLHFWWMKNFAVASFKFFITFLVSILCASIVLMTSAMLEHGMDRFGITFYGIVIASVPLAVITAVFSLFFRLNRTLTSRIRGYLTVIPLAAVALLGAAILVRFTGIPTAEGIAGLPEEYRLIGEWMASVSKASWPEFSAGLTSFTFFSAAFWCLTRLSRSRPLLGAFLAPSGALAALYLFSLYQSGPADAMFALLGLRLPRLMTASLLAGASALALFAFDALFARKPSGRGRNA